MLVDKIITRPEPDFARLLNVLRRQKQTGRVPFYELFANPETMVKVLGKPVPDRAATIEFYYRCGYDYVPAWPHVAMQMGNLVDTRLGYPIRDWQSFDAYDWPKPGSVDFSEFEQVAGQLPDGMKIIAQTAGVFETVESLFGYQNLCLKLYDDPTLVDAVFARVSEIYREIYAGMSSLDQVGAVVISDDLGFKTQTLISPEDLRRHVLPVHKMLCELVHRQNKPCILHSCGNLSSVMEDLITDVKIDAKHSYEDMILPVEAAAKQYGDRIAILGGFDVDSLIRLSPDEIRAKTLQLLETLGCRGGYALGSGNSIPGSVPVENYLAMLETGWNHVC